MLQLIGLTGKHQGASFDIVEGFLMSSSDKNSNLQLGEEDSGVFEIGVTDLGIFILKTHDESPSIQCGDENLNQLVLVPGIIFSIGNDGFSVQEMDDQELSSKVSTSIASLFKNIEPNKTKPINLIEKKVTFKFVRGPLLECSWDIITSPTSFGLKSVLHFFLDPTIQLEEDFLTLTNDDNDNIYLEGHIPGLISLNGGYLQGRKSVSDGDLVEFGQTAFYIEIV